MTHIALYVLVRAVVFPGDHFAFVESFAFWFVRRFHGNLLYYWTFVIGAHALQYSRVPNLLLQPLVENAIQHGIASRPEGGTVEIRSRRDNGRLIIAVRDSGPAPALKPDRPLKEGIGLSNIRQHLDCLYGSNCEMRCGPHPDGGFETVIALPFGRAANSSQPEDNLPDSPEPAHEES